MFKAVWALEHEFASRGQAIGGNGGSLCDAGAAVIEAVAAASAEIECWSA